MEDGALLVELFAWPIVPVADVGEGGAVGEKPPEKWCAALVRGPEKEGVFPSEHEAGQGGCEERV